MASPEHTSTDRGTICINNLEVYSKLFIEYVECVKLLPNCRTFLDAAESKEFLDKFEKMPSSGVAEEFVQRMVTKHLKVPGNWKLFLQALKDSGYSRGPYSRSPSITKTFQDGYKETSVKDFDSENGSDGEENERLRVSKGFPEHDLKAVDSSSQESLYEDALSEPESPEQPIQDNTTQSTVTADRETTGQKSLDDVTPKLRDTSFSDEEGDEINYEPISLRDYQTELAGPALNGKNVIVCAPTGSGKTRVAFRIIQNHLTGRCNKIRKVVFLVNQVPLAEQQHKECEKVLPMYKSKVLTGDTQASSKVPFGEILKRNDILVMTAQILIESLLHKDIPNIGAFTLMVFDECHHTHSNHPFNQLMHFYMEMKFSNDSLAHHLPQIVGLTASLGVGKAKNLQGATDHVKKLMSNMDTEDIATVNNYPTNLASFVNVPKEELKTARAREFDPFKDTICEIMVEIEKYMADHDGLDKIKETNPRFLNVLTAPSSKGCATYTEWVSKFLREVAVLRVPEVKRVYTTCRQHLQIYNDALIINTDCRSSDAVKILFEEFGKLVRDKDDTDKKLMGWLEDKERTLKEMGSDPRIENPKLLELKKMIETATAEKGDLRGIVFVRTRLLAECVERWMNETPGLKDLKPIKFVGATVRADRGGMTKHQQINVMEFFKDGKHKLIIATSIAQEGLDISKCNLVIRYDHVTNEIALVQSRGRARKDDSSYKVLGQQGTGTVEKEEVNLMREQLMKEALRELKQSIGQNTSRFAEEREKMQREAKVDRELKAQKRKYRTHHEGEFELLCLKCDEFCCLSTSIRQIEKAHHIVIDEYFHERVNISDHPRPISYDGFQKKVEFLVKIVVLNGELCLFILERN